MTIFSVDYMLSGDCQSLNTGAVSLVISGDAPDYRIEFLSPVLPTIYLTNYDIDYTITGLSGGSYVIVVKDSSLYTNSATTSILSAFTFSVNISSGTCVSIDDIIHTTCGDFNGSITASTPYYWSYPPTFELYDINGNLIETKSNSIPTVVFDNLEPGIYYVVVSDDGGGCSGRSESVIIKDSTEINFDFYIVNNSGCYGNLGKIYITGLTGTPPFTYLWSNGETTDHITGLTAGIYSVQVTDALGCTIFPKFATVTNADPLAIIDTIIEPPGCNGELGNVTLVISGGTPPYNFSGSNNVTQLVFTNTYTFTNLQAVNYQFLVTDAGLCNATTSVSLFPQNSFVFSSLNITNSNCNGFGGQVDIFLLGAGIFTYTITNGFTITRTLTAGNSATFQDLPTGTYQLIITHDVPGGCTYNGSFTITNTPPFEVFPFPTGTTCNRNNGSVEVQIVGSGQTPYTVAVTGVPSITNLYLSSTTIYNLAPGSYVVTVTDSNGCVNREDFYISPSVNLDFIVVYNQGNLYLNILQGTPPFTVQWGAPYQSETGFTIYNVTSGNYSVTVTDSSGCVRVRDQQVEGLNVQTGQTTVSLCQNVFSPGVMGRRTISKMFFEGYKDLIQNETNCRLTFANFYVDVTVSGETKSEMFYSGNSFNLPTNLDTLYANSVISLLESFYGIGDITYDPTNNIITIETDCDLPYNLLSNAQILIDLRIDYEIQCDYCSFLFINCCDSNDTINVGILYDNFSIGDVIKVYDSCYYYTGNSGTGVAGINRQYPDYLNVPNPCESCKQSFLTPPC